MFSCITFCFDIHPETLTRGNHTPVRDDRILFDNYDGISNRVSLSFRVRTAGSGVDRDTIPNPCILVNDCAPNGGVASNSDVRQMAFSVKSEGIRCFIIVRADNDRIRDVHSLLDDRPGSENAVIEIQVFGTAARTN